MAESGHASLSQAARTQGAKESELNGTISVHHMPDSVSFSGLSAIMAAAERLGHENRVFVGSIDGGLVLSVNFAYSTAQDGPRKRKRNRGDDDASAQAVDRVRKAVAGDKGVSENMLTNVQAAAAALVESVRGAHGEEVVESWGVSAKSEEKETEKACKGRPKLVLSARLAAGVAISVSQLKTALGPYCSKDGLLTVSGSAGMDTSFQLPASAATRAAETAGQKSMLLFATVESAD